MSTGADAWLFTRGNQSLYVKRLPMAITLVVCGPGEDEHTHHFQSEASLDEFWSWYRKHLLSSDWLQSPSTERRAALRDPAGQPDRRRRLRDQS